MDHDIEIISFAEWCKKKLGVQDHIKLNKVVKTAFKITGNELAPPIQLHTERKQPILLPMTKLI